jgi:hypothetical protein
VQVIGSLLAMFGGAELVDLGHTCLGLTMLFTFLLVLLDGLFRNPVRAVKDPRELTVSDVLERYERAR